MTHVDDGMYRLRSTLGGALGQMVPGAYNSIPQNPTTSDGPSATQVTVQSADDLCDRAGMLADRAANVVERLVGPSAQAPVAGQPQAPPSGFFERIQQAHAATRDRLDRLASALATLEALVR